MIEPHTIEAGHTLYVLGRIALTFGLIGTGTWLVIKLMLRSGKRRLSNKHLGINRHQRRAERAKAKHRRRQPLPSKPRSSVQASLMSEPFDRLEDFIVHEDGDSRIPV